MLPFTPEELRDAVNSGRVTCREHPTLPLYIYNYAPDVQFTNSWDDVTLNCRGLILDNHFNIVARPWKKFFNLGQVNLPIQFDTPVEVMDKADGSLGILYPNIIDGPEAFDVHWGIATRGSFASDQAAHATVLWNQRYSRLDPLPGYTMLFEIIYPANRIVLNYGGVDDLMLLGAVQNETGYYIGPNEAKYMWTLRGGSSGNPYAFAWPGPVVEVMPYNSISEALAHTDRPNAEGYVIRSHNFMVKIKQPDYLDLHKLVTNASPKTVWEKLRDGKSRSEIVSAFPDEFHDYIASMVDPLIEAYDSRLTQILDNYGAAKYRVDLTCRTIGREPSRKDYASVFSKSQDAKFYFLLLDNKPIREVLWSSLKPKESAIDAAVS